ncbi:MAG: beta-N-acetylhexosaminidase [Planctomycetota bacterium]
MTPLLHELVVVAAAGLFLTQVATAQPGQVIPAGASVVPRPVKVEGASGTFAITKSTPILIEEGLQREPKIATYFADVLSKSAGFTLKVTATDKVEPPSGAILLTTQRAQPGLGDEGYELSVTSNGVLIRAPKEAGLFYGVQTLLQLLSPDVFSQARVTSPREWTVPCVKIEDPPRFTWRGLLVDTSRHFFTKQELLDFLDVMAIHKLNTFHWHINDDPGWRLEIKKYPLLTEVGAWRDGIDFGLDPQSSTAYDEQGRYGGFYTQNDVREIVAYAADRFITIVPEFEMPAHSWASRRAYPELSCDDPPTVPGAPAPQPTPKLAYCAGKESTFRILEEILSEALPLFPSPVVHIGGDECDKRSWQACPKCQARIKAEGLANEEELQSYFIRRIERFLNSKGKRLMGWSEIQQGGIAPNAMLMDWIGGGLQAAQSGHDVVMSPTTHCYLDYYQAKGPEPKAIGGYLPLETVYAFEPIPAGLAPEYSKHILGVQGNLWTEFIPNYRHLQYMAYPRACAIAEVGWTPAAVKDWGDFQRRLERHLARLGARGVNYRVPAAAARVGGWTPAQMSEQFKTLDWDVTPHVQAAKTYNFIFCYEKGACRLDIEWAALLENGKELSRDTHLGITGARTEANEYKLGLEALDPKAKYTLRASVRSDGGTDSTGGIWLKVD